MGGAVPVAGDSVSLGAASGTTCDTDILVVDATTPALDVVTVQSTTASCGGSLRVNDGVSLRAATVVVNGVVYLNGLAASVSATTSFTLNALGLLQGTGIVDSPATVLRGSVSPGVVNGCGLATCMYVYAGASFSAGSLVFPGAVTTFIGADIYLKYIDLSAGGVTRGLATFDQLSFATVKFATTASSIWLDVVVKDATQPITYAPFTYTTRILDMPYTSGLRVGAFPWQRACCVTDDSCGDAHATNNECAVSSPTGGVAVTTWSSCTSGIGFILGEWRWFVSV